MENLDSQANSRERNQETVHISSNLMDDALISLLLTPTTSLDFSNRTKHLLEKYEINIAADLYSVQGNNLLVNRGIGPSTLNEIQEVSRQFYLQIERDYSKEYINNVINRIQKSYFFGSSSKKELSSYEIDLPRNSLETLPLSVRTRNALLRNRIKSQEDLLRTSEESLRQIRNIGEKSIREINLVKAQLLFNSDKGLNASKSISSIINETTKNQFDLPKSIKIKLASIGITNLTDISSLSDEDLLVDGGLSYLEFNNVQKYLSSVGVNLNNKWPREALVSNSDYKFLKRLGVPFDKIDISRLALPSNLEGILKHNLHIFSIEQLVCQSKIILQAALFLFNNNSLGILEKNIKLYIDWLPTQSDWDKEISKSIPSPLYFLQLRDTSLEKIVEYFLAGISSERHKRIILLRFGLDVEERKTLQQVAEQFSITRERVRQMETLAFGKLFKLQANSLIQTFYYCLKNEMEKRGGLVSIDQFALLIENFMEIGEIKLNGAISFLLYLEKEVFIEIERSRLWGLRNVPLEKIGSVRRVSLDLLKRHYAPLSFSELVDGLKKSKWYSDIPGIVTMSDEFIKACISTDDDFEEIENGLWILNRWKKSNVDDIVMALHKLGKPSHFTVIMTAANETLPPMQRLSSRNCHAILSRKTDLFVWVGRGTFGLSEWGIKKVRFYVDIAEEYLEQRKEPLSNEEIFSHINVEREASLENISFMLSTNHRFSKFPNNKYGLARWIQDTSNDVENNDDNIVIEDPFLDDLKNKFFNDFQTDR